MQNAKQMQSDIDACCTHAPVSLRVLDQRIEVTLHWSEGATARSSQVSTVPNEIT